MDKHKFARHSTREHAAFPRKSGIATQGLDFFNASGVCFMLGNIIGIAVVFISFGFIIFIHELGHFLMARRVGIKVHEFALGFGPKLWSRKSEKDGTLYALRAFPFGGYVSMEGEDESKKADPSDSQNFQNKTNWQKIKVIAAGPLMNYAMAILLFLFTGFAFGIGEMYLKPKVGKIIPDSPAQKIGLKEGDLIVSVNGGEIEDAMEMIGIIHRSAGKEIELKVKRGEDLFTRRVKPMEKEVPYSPEMGDEYKTVERNGEKFAVIGLVGFQPDTKSMDIRFRRAPFGEVMADCAVKTYKFSISPFVAVGMMIKGQIGSKELVEGSSGPVGIGQMFFEMYAKGVPALIFFLAIINVLIGVFNLIPFPALDGARIAALFIAWLIRREFDPAKEGLVHAIGFWILMLLVIFFTYNDIVRIIKGVKFF